MAENHYKKTNGDKDHINNSKNKRREVHMKKRVAINNEGEATQGNGNIGVTDNNNLGQQQATDYEDGGKMIEDIDDIDNDIDGNNNSIGVGGGYL